MLSNEFIALLLIAISNRGILSRWHVLIFTMLIHWIMNNFSNINKQR